MNYEAYIKRLVEIKENIDSSAGAEKDSWINYLLGYISAVQISTKEK